KRDDLGPPLERPAEIGEIDPPVLGDLDHAERGTLLLTQDLPRHQIRVVVHRGDHHAVASLHVGTAIRARHQVDRFGGAPGEHHALGRPGVRTQRASRAPLRTPRWRGSRGRTTNANVHRGAYDLAIRATVAYEATR